MENTPTSDTYESPQITEIGTLHELTLQPIVDKTAGPTDGFTVDGVPVTFTSP